MKFEEVNALDVIGIYQLFSYIDVVLFLFLKVKKMIGKDVHYENPWALKNFPSVFTRKILLMGFGNKNLGNFGVSISKHNGLVMVVLTQFSRSL